MMIRVHQPLNNEMDVGMPNISMPSASFDVVVIFAWSKRYMHGTQNHTTMTSSCQGSAWDADIS